MALRQGEWADYLMRDGDYGGGALLSSSRPYAVRFSPYNLTAGTLDILEVGFNGAGPNPGIPTAYPTQAGAMFQWANATNIRYAWNPNVTGSISSLGWNASYPGTASDYWTGGNNLSATHESCPAPYRRPTDGATNVAVPVSATNVVGSEFRQSLWLHPQTRDGVNSTANAVWGYYADGFFDRRQISSGAVSSGTRDVAYQGQLFYNSASNASLFFPAAGRRDSGTTGALSSLGSGGFYWSSSTAAISPTANSWNIELNNGTATLYHNTRSNGFSIRCIRSDSDSEFTITADPGFDDGGSASSDKWIIW
jgi:hypothetical protein